jgi:hypothetical protein
MTNRIQTLPARRWRDRAADAIPALTAALRQPGGTQQLHDIQAVALLELWECGGSFVNARVGAGKTLVSGLAGTLMAAKGFVNPLLVVPASLREKTDAEFREARHHWKIMHQYRLASYTELALVKHADLLDTFKPDMLIFDEPDALRRLKASAVAKRVKRYVLDRRAKGLPLCCLFLTGTPDRDALTDYAHMIHWALGDGAPFPTAGADLEWQELASWSAWLDKGEHCERGAFEKYFPPHGPATTLPGDEPAPIGSSERACDQYRDRLISTPGIIVSDDTFEGAELEVNVYFADTGLEKEFEMLRTLWLRPDGWDVLDAGVDEKSADDVDTFSIWGIARQLACGFYYTADPVAPKDWLSARKAWAYYVRQIIDDERNPIDTMKQVENACVKAVERGIRVPEWTNWRDIKDTFKPGKRPVWLNDHAIDAATYWGAQSPGIVWTDHIAYGHRLSQKTGWAFFGQNGLDGSGRNIEAERGDRTVIASRLANQRGRNLQYAFNRSLVMALPNAARDAEQLVGRTHRYGQTKQIVTADLLVSCTEHIKALEKLGSGARRTRRQTGLSQKILNVGIKHHGSPPQGWAYR